MPEDYKFALNYLKNLTRLLEERKVIPVPCRLMPGGLGDIGKRFEEMHARRFRGEKLVYLVAGDIGAEQSLMSERHCTHFPLEYCLFACWCESKRSPD